VTYEHVAIKEERQVIVLKWKRKRSITMAVPELTPEERQQALEKAKAARIKRAQVREDLKNGTLTLKDVLAMKDDPIVGRMKASTLIETLPGYGKAKAEKIMKELDIAESRRLKGLGERQQKALLERLG
jgi:hypothetical protein